jgi:ACR3 family arsenite transporter
MMWPILTKGIHFAQLGLAILTFLVQYEKLPAMFQTVTLWRQIALSVVLNWVLGPFVSFPEPVEQPMVNS